MAVKAPSREDLARIGRALGLNLSAEDAESFRRLLLPSIDALSRLDELVEPTLPVMYPRGGGWRPQPEENPFNAWYWRCEIKGAPEGLLQGKTFAIKDNGLCRRHSDDERYAATRRLRSQYRRYPGYANPQCRRYDSGQGCMREPLFFRRKPYLGHGPRAQLARSEAYERRIVER